MSADTDQAKSDADELEWIVCPALPQRRPCLRQGVLQRLCRCGIVRVEPNRVQDGSEVLLEPLDPRHVGVLDAVEVAHLGHRAPRGRHLL